MPIRFQALDSWRGACAVLVALYHFPKVFHGSDWEAIGNFYLFVDFFFVLSGFVLTHRYAGEPSSGREFFHFMCLRLGRIYPLHIFSMLLCIAAMFVLTVIQFWGPGLARMFANGDIFRFVNPAEISIDVLLLHSFGLWHALHLNWPSWSIAAEFYTYAVFGLALLGGHRSVRAVMALAIFACPLVIFTQKGHMDVSYDYGFIRCLFGFACGYWAYQLHLALGGRFLSLSLAKASLAEALILLGTAVFVLSAGLEPYSILSPFMFIAVVLVFAAERGAFSRALIVKPMLRLGELSFSIYLLHAILILIAERVLEALSYSAGLARDAPSLMGDAVFISFAAALFFAARLSHAHVEMPYKYVFSDAFKRMSPPRPAQTETAPV